MGKQRKLINKPENWCSIYFATLLHLSSKSPVWWSYGPSWPKLFCDSDYIFYFSLKQIWHQCGPLMPGKKRKNKQKKPHQNTQSRYSRHHSASKHTQYITSRSKLLHAFQRSLVFRSLRRYLARKRFCIRKLSLLPMFRHWIRFFKDHLMLESSPKTGKVKTRMPKTVKYQIKKKKWSLLM